ncbi:transducin/WD40 repeat-like superfamily protein [Actinidia rufa]|uniref:tRNA (guanine-N(7)-)-methyltransferase non-catalytic subunit n=1 Tax=Actinidia rufa TaxID=165716 RepID=A0A7J0FJD2_9ERIC|nr:transducin/WD40 repeat-like superfamily protein [Actinidia rufa]
MEETAMEDGDHSRDREVAPALIAIHPTQESVAVAVGSDLRVFDLQNGCPISLVDDSSEPFHLDSIRVIRYGAKGKLLVTAGDDKLVKIWNTDAWRCIYTVSSEKRVSAVAISNDGLFVCFADKFGVVWVVGLNGLHETQTLSSKKAVPILAHYCSIITSLEFSTDGRFIASADRDFKIRVTVFPKKPLDGAHEIQSFCLGHTEYVSCLAFVCALEYPEGFLVSGSGDSTVRLWHIASGSLLDTCEVSAEAGLVESNGKEDECCFAITDLCAIPSSSLVAVAIQGQNYPDVGVLCHYRLPGVVLLSCNLSDKTLSISKVISIDREAFIPTSLGTSSSAEFLWMVTGVSNLQGSDSTSLTRVKAISGLTKINPDSGELETTVLEDGDVPGGMQLLEKLQGSASIKEEVFLAAAESVKIAMRNLLIKKQYSVERRDFRKRGRNDRKIKH